MQETADYSTITEAPGTAASREQLERLYQRYHFASQYLKSGQVLEIACGAGIGLGYLARYADKVTGIDIDNKNLALAADHYRNAANVSVQRMDAHALSFGDGTFNAVLCFEALYYMNDLDKCLSEMHRVLRGGGTCILCTVNKDWADFHPSPFAARYYSVPELFDLLRPHSDVIRFFGGFYARPRGLKEKTVSYVKRAAVAMHLIPQSLKVRSYLKRIFMGKLVSLPDEVYADMTSYANPTPIPPNARNEDYKIIYAVVTKDRAGKAAGI